MGRGGSRSELVGAGLSDRPPGRSCTDVGFVPVWLGFWVAVLWIAAWCHEHGNPYSMVYGLDSWGNVCGQSQNVAVAGVPNSGLDMSGRKHQLYTIGPADVGPRQNVVICAMRCPTERRACSADDPYCRDTLGVCVAGGHPYSLPAAGGNTSQCGEATHPGSVNGGCPASVSATVQASVFNRCLPASDGGEDAAVYRAARNSYGDVEEILESLAAGLPIIQVCLLTALLMAYLVVVSMQYFIRPLVWGLIGGLVAVEIWSCGCLYGRYTYLADDVAKQERAGAPVSASERRDRDFYLGMFVLAVVVTVLLLLIVIACRHAIKKAILIYREASKVTFKMAAMFVSPFLTWVLILLWLLFWMAVTIHMATTGEAVAQRNCAMGVGYGHVKHVPRQNYDSFLWFYVLALFWVVEFLIVCEQLIISGCVCSYYVTRGHPPRWIWLRSMQRVGRYHLGTAIFASLVIAVVQTARMLLECVAKRTSGAGAKGTISKFLFCCCRCCLWCLHKVIRFVSRHALVEVMLYGLDFCNGCVQATQSIMLNLATVGALSFVGALLCFLVKLLITLVTTLLAFYWIQDQPEVEYQSVVLLCVAIMAWMVSAAFVGVYAMVADALLICFCEDCNQKDGPKLAPAALLRMVKEAAAHTQHGNKVAPHSPDGNPRGAEVLATGVDVPEQQASV